MPSHRFHPTAEDPPGVVLYDGCDRCTEQAAEPLHLDADRLGDLWLRMVHVEKIDPDRGHYLTRTEASACRWLYRLAVFVERTHPGIDPWTWPWRMKGAAETVLTDALMLGAPLLPLPMRDDERDRRPPSRDAIIDRLTGPAWGYTREQAENVAAAALDPDDDSTAARLARLAIREDGS